MMLNASSEHHHPAMTPLEELHAAGIPVTWSTVRLGLEGPGATGPQVDLTDVRSWLETAMGGDEPPEGEVDALVAIDGGARPLEILSQLPEEPTPWPPAGELQKWQWVMLQRELRGLPSDPFYAALTLADFWSQFGDMEGAPAPTATELASKLTDSDREQLVGRQEAWLTTTREALAAR
jgi:acyl transferase domain-containing protein